MGAGQLAALVAAMIWACTSVALTSLSTRVSPVVLSGLRLSFGSLVVLVVLFASGQAESLGDASQATLLGVILSGFVGYGLGDTEEFWILDVEGTRLMIEANWSPDSPRRDVAEVRAILDSIQIEP